MAVKIVAGPLLAALLTSACAHSGRPAPPASDPTALSRLAAAGASLHTGCLDCLADAFREYESLRQVSAVADQATAGAIRAAALIDIRERELGLASSGSLAWAKTLAERLPSTALMYTKLLEIVEFLRLGPGSRAPMTDEQISAMLYASRNRAEWSNWLREVAATDELTSYVWLSFACASGTLRIDDVAVVVDDVRDTPLASFAYLTECDRDNPDALRALLNREPRFEEVNYFLGLAALGRRPSPDVDTAGEWFDKAYRWRQDWPSLTVSIANLALATEDFTRAFTFFARTLDIVPGHPDAMTGQIRALTYLGRYREALETVDVLLATGQNQGEGRYWRAFNEHRLGEIERAWGDVEIARTLLVNADVPKLGGIIALERREIDIARQKLDEARRRNPSDCETQFYLQTAQADAGLWPETVATASSAARCFDAAEIALQNDIEAIRASNGVAERLVRQVVRREQEIASNSRMRAAACFNAAVAAFNLGRSDVARDFANRVAGDEQFGPRARAVLARLPSP